MGEGQRSGNRRHKKARQFPYEGKPYSLAAPDAAAPQAAHSCTACLNARSPPPLLQCKQQGRGGAMTGRMLSWAVAPSNEQQPRRALFPLELNRASPIFRQWKKAAGTCLTPPFICPLGVCLQQWLSSRVQRICSGAELIQPVPMAPGRLPPDLAGHPPQGVYVILKYLSYIPI